MRPPQRIRYVILDEIHCISSPEEGKVWEHVLLLLSAPFIALSATVGDPEAFVSWLQTIKDAQVPPSTKHHHHHYYHHHPHHPRPSRMHRCPPTLNPRP